MGGPKGWGPKKKVANAEIYVIFEVFAFCGGRTKTDFKDRGYNCIGRLLENENAVLDKKYRVKVKYLNLPCQARAPFSKSSLEEGVICADCGRPETRVM